jgi:selenocysteine lyase/cysteine desulfurase
MRAVLGDRALFDRLRARAYLNHAAVSPPSAAVRRAVQAVIDDFAADGVHAVLRWVEQRDRLRAKLAALVGAQATDVGFCANTTAGVTAVALCSPHRRGDRIVVFDGEFPANVTPWQRAAKLPSSSRPVCACPCRR